MIINDKEYVFKLHDKTYHCAMDVTMSYIGGKWKTVVLWYLRNKTLRFGELKKADTGHYRKDAEPATESPGRRWFGET